MSEKALPGTLPANITEDAGPRSEAATAPPFLAAASSPMTAPTRLDPRDYELNETLGQGGMGEVYRCCDPALGRDLAIKVMKREFQDHSAIESRFLREARITGSLQHPNIVAVHNLGRLGDGRLHYTMRLVRGRTFADILKEDAGKPDRLASLLTIYQKVCEAAAYAHSKRVIHRDLKPVNIMVGKFGEVQVMDWGLAKLLSAEGEQVNEEPPLEAGGTFIPTESADTPADLTRAGTGIGTPAYMPPEQAQGDWELVDERADVFALGAILCEMLTGKPPYMGQDGNEILRRAKRCDLEEALSSLEQCGADASLTQLCRECLAVDCQQRPRNADVVARRVSAYQTEVEHRLRLAELERTEAEVKKREERKRRRLALSLSGVVLLVFLIGTLISTLFAFDARRQADEARKHAEDAELERQRANEKRQEAITARDAESKAKQQVQKERDKAESVLKELVHTFQLIDPKYQGRTVQAREILDDAARRIPETFPDQLDTQASLFEAIGNVYNSLGFYSSGAEPLLRRALALRVQVLGKEHPDTASSYNSLGLNLHNQGKYQQAEDCNRIALTIFDKALGEDHPSTAISFDNLAAALNAQGKYKEAEASFRKALAIRRKVLGEEHPDTAQSYNNIAYNLNAQSKHIEAEEGYRRALAIRRKMLGEEHPITASSYNNLAQNLNFQGKYPGAEEGFRKALAIRRKVLGEEHPDTAQSYHNLAYHQYSQANYREAEEGYRKALAIRRKRLGDEHPDTAQSYDGLALNLNAQGKYPGAEEGFRKALAIRRKVLGEVHPDTAQSYHNLAYNLNSQGKYTEAENYWGRAAEAFANARRHVAAAGLERAAFASARSPLLHLCGVLARNGKPEEAWQRFEESLARGIWEDLTARTRRLPKGQSKQSPTANRSERIFSRDKIQAALPPDAALLAWLDIPGQAQAADSDGEHWAVLLRSTGSSIWIRLHGSGDKGAWTDADTRLPSDLRTALQRPGTDWKRSADSLRRQRMEPLLKHLTACDGLPAVRRLIVLPSTALAGVPVDLIADNYIVSYAPSGTLYTHLRQEPPPTGNGLLAVGDPVFDSPAENGKNIPLPPGGVLLTVIIPGSNAAHSGLKPNDVLLRYGDTPLTAIADFKPLPESSDPDKRVPVIVWRDGRQLPRPLFVRPGKLGVVIAKEPAPQALAEQRRIDRLLQSRARGGDRAERWARLPATRIEVTSLQGLFDKASSRILLGSDASEQRLQELSKTGELGKYRYIHLATHGEINNALPLRSAVILSRDRLPDDKQRTELLLSSQPVPDGRLTAEEMLNHWKLNCDLVTLSACQSALGKYEQGEGFVGFTQALLLSGSRSVCLSLWKLDDTATALLMIRFYENLLGKREELKAPMGRAEALAEAKKWLRELPRKEVVRRTSILHRDINRGKGKPLQSSPLKQNPMGGKINPFSHPYYWAAFILIGDPS